MDLRSKLEDALRQILEDVQHAARNHDIASAEKSLRKAAELQMLEAEFDKFEAHINSVLTNSGQISIPTPPPASGQNLRRLPVQVTGGMIRQNLLTLTEHVKHSRINVGETMFIEVQPFGEKFQTTLLKNSYKLQERGAIGRFYQYAQIREGDVVVLIETAPGKWVLQRGEPGEWDGHFRYKRVLLPDSRFLD